MACSVSSSSHPSPSNESDYRMQLLIASTRGDWETANQLFNTDSNGWTMPTDTEGNNPFCVAAMAGQTKFMEKLIQLMPRESLERQGMDGSTHLHDIATTGNTKLAKILISRILYLTQVRNIQYETPLLRAVRFGHKDLVRYLYPVTGDVYPRSPFRGVDGAVLLCAAIDSDFYDVALDLVRLYPNIATTEILYQKSAIHRLASKSWPSMDQGGGVWFLKPCTHLMLQNQDTVFASSMQKLVPGLKIFSETKILQKQYLKLVDAICKKLEDLKDVPKMREFINGTIVVASENGNLEFVKSILHIDPTQMLNGKNKPFVLHIAVKHRQENIFNFIKNSALKDELASWEDVPTDDTILHLAARSAPPSKLKALTGAALQMQRELQWYKEVEAMIQPSYRHRMNYKDEIPKELFTEEHKELVKEGEKWMKDMASSSMLAAILIATVVFAAAFTIPGGNRSDKGIPIFLHTRAYMIFAVSNALSLFSSLTSVLIFLFILTARYAEEDFLVSLPQKLIIGLTMLFFSIITMTIAFTATYFIMLGRRLTWVSILISLLACFPATLFAFLQLPLFIEMIHSTYRSTL